MRASGGGAKSAFWRGLLAGILNKRVVTLETQEGSAYGAALLALVGTGEYASAPEVCRAAIRETESVSPSAGDVAIGGSVTITAAPGWVLSADTSSTPGAIELRTADAILVAQAVQNSFHGDLASLLGTVEGQLQTDAAQVSFGESHSTSIGGHAASYATFEATMSSSTGTGVIDGEIVCLDVAGTVVVVEVATPQGRFDYVAGDVSAMLESLRPSA